MTINCPECNASFDVAQEIIGTEVDCLQCNFLFIAKQKISANIKKSANKKAEDNNISLNQPQKQIIEPPTFIKSMLVLIGIALFSVPIGIGLGFLIGMLAPPAGCVLGCSIIYVCFAANSLFLATRLLGPKENSASLSIAASLKTGAWTFFIPILISIILIFAMIGNFLSLISIFMPILGIYFILFPVIHIIAQVFVYKKYYQKTAMNAFILSIVQNLITFFAGGFCLSIIATITFGITMLLGGGAFFENLKLEDAINLFNKNNIQITETVNEQTSDLIEFENIDLPVKLQEAQVETKLNNETNIKQIKSLKVQTEVVPKVQVTKLEVKINQKPESKIQEIEVKSQIDLEPETQIEENVKTIPEQIESRKALKINLNIAELSINDKIKDTLESISQTNPNWIKLKNGGLIPIWKKLEDLDGTFLHKKPLERRLGSYLKITGNIKFIGQAYIEKKHDVFCSTQGTNPGGIKSLLIYYDGNVYKVFKNGEQSRFCIFAGTVVNSPHFFIKGTIKSSEFGHKSFADIDWKSQKKKLVSNKNKEVIEQGFDVTLKDGTICKNAKLETSGFWFLIKYDGGEKILKNLKELPFFDIETKLGTHKNVEIISFNSKKGKIGITNNAGFLGVIDIKNITSEIKYFFKYNKNIAKVAKSEKKLELSLMPKQTGLFYGPYQEKWEKTGINAPSLFKGTYSKYISVSPGRVYYTKEREQIRLKYWVVNEMDIDIANFSVSYKLTEKSGKTQSKTVNHNYPHKSFQFEAKDNEAKYLSLAKNFDSKYSEIKLWVSEIKFEKGKINIDQEGTIIKTGVVPKIIKQGNKTAPTVNENNEFDYNLDEIGKSLAGGGMVIGVIVLIVGLGVSLLMLISMWRILSKAGLPGWALLIPIYNTIVILKLAGKPAWWFFLLFIPIIDIIILFLIPIGIARTFGKGIGFAFGIMFFPIIFLPILAFGKSECGYGY